MRKPTKDGFSIQHEKTWLFDKHMLMIGSMNATYNSVRNCEEVGIFMNTAREVSKAMEHVERSQRLSVGCLNDEMASGADQLYITERGS